MVAVGKPQEPPAQRGAPLDPAQPRPGALDGERPGGVLHLGPDQRPLRLGQGVRSQSGIGVEQEQPVAAARGDPGAELPAATPIGVHHAAAARRGELGGPVAGAAVGDDDFSGDGERGQVGQQPRQPWRFVERRDDDRQQRDQLRTSVWKRERRSRVTGPGRPPPMSRPSSCRMPTTSEAVPVKKASSAV